MSNCLEIKNCSYCGLSPQYSFGTSFAEIWCVNRTCPNSFNALTGDRKDGTIKNWNDMHKNDFTFSKVFVNKNGDTIEVKKPEAKDYTLNESDISENTTKDPNTKYNHPIMGMDGTKTTVDVYRVQAAFNITDPEIIHAHKKLSMAGNRGKGSKRQDVLEAKISLEKWLVRDEQEQAVGK